MKTQSNTLSWYASCSEPEFSYFEPGVDEGKTMILSNIKTPCYIFDEGALVHNLEILSAVQKSSGAKVLLAQKAFSMYTFYPLIGKYLTGTAAASLNEARLGHEEMKGGETHIYSPAYSVTDFDEIEKICDYVVFNSFAQWERFGRRGGSIHRGIRINPEYSEISVNMYNPCYEGSRLGVRISDFPDHLPEGIDGFHFHTMCEQNADVLWRTVLEVDRKFGKYLSLPQIKWINFGGGQHITKDGYDMETLVKSVKYMKDKYDLTVYLEPGEAIALNAGYFVTRVMDIVNNGISIAVVDASAACHMPDVLEMPYRPPLFGSGNPGEKDYTYRLGGPTCLAGDIIGDYSFDEPLKIGDVLVFGDMAIYTTVKNNTFNGINLPAIYIRRQNGYMELYKEFGYEDFKRRL